MPKVVRTCDVGTATASADTTETSIGSVTLPSNAIKIVGVGVSCGGAGATTLEGVSGIFRISINNLSVEPAKFPFSYGLPIASGVVPTKPDIWEVQGWEPAGSSVISGYITMDMTETVNNTFRLFVVYDKLVA